MIIVTGGAGFIGSAFVWKLNTQGIEDILIVDNLNYSEKWRNLVKLRFFDYMHKDEFIKIILAKEMPFNVRAIIHMGACSSTTERNADYLMSNNYHYSCRLAEWSIAKNARFIYASSAATYGNGSLGFSDDDSTTNILRPINMYGYSKQLFDLWVIRNELNKRVVGIKFFNVFGPNEYHKGDMTSVVYKAFQQIKENGKVRLFKSYRSEYGDGEQRRDFVYVKDCVEVMWWFLNNPDINGIFNLGSGQSRTWNDLIKAAFSAMKMEPRIDYFDMPLEIRDQYQYFTEAKMEKLKMLRCPVPFRSMEESVSDYIVNHLKNPDPFL